MSIQSVEDETYEFTKDITLNVTSFMKLQYFTDREALARMIHHIVMTNPGTYPNNPDFGVGIENYIFELATQSTLAELKTKITEQIKKWINAEARNNISIGCEAKYIYPQGNPSSVSLALYFTVSTEYSATKITDEELEQYTINMYISGDPQQRQLLSKVEIDN